MKRIFYLLIFIGFSLQAQYNPIWNTLLSSWNFTKDTSVTIQSTYNYKWTLSIDCDTLAGTLNGTWGIKTKINGHDKWHYICKDTTLTPFACKQTFSSANYSEIINGYEIPGDSLKIELKHGGITSGTVSIKLKRY